MNSILLEQLLDCPVCFERFDSTNRVLPCQHTFCKRCLEMVRNRNKELHCPECRTKYDGCLSDLPCNIFIIRILEQLKQAEKASSLSSVLRMETRTDTTNQEPSSEIPSYNNSAFSSTNSASQLTISPEAVSLNPRRTRIRVQVDNEESFYYCQEQPERIRRVLGATRRTLKSELDMLSTNQLSSSNSPSSLPTTTTTTTTTITASSEEKSNFNPNVYRFNVDLKSDKYTRNANILKHSRLRSRLDNSLSSRPSSASTQLGNTFSTGAGHGAVSSMVSNFPGVLLDETVSNTAASNVDINKSTQEVTRSLSATSLIALRNETVHFDPSMYSFCVGNSPNQRRMSKSVCTTSRPRKNYLSSVKSLVNG